ncbi:DNA internalization-related competence protein ComEC/Rec2 [Paenibacillus sp. GSMTC-2017]|uniref:DNA internalization-related competence protein ComEC/Rec2 n=1 Tax=Paenibacillus sp. GSMTC-2017 TaxID=2794350 RepID=UPI0018DA2197|nr:DNA internalization-related competence protein ComEC/Rec2 [Paenibacillus sp. GSMTC-2017]MBH5318165.1 DNA internalization-related competence protein ComEC/Rec2 [Paenibacillus sp. GSMTC-2017]
MGLNRRPVVWFAVCWVSGSAAAASLELQGALLVAGAATLLAIAAVMSRLATGRLAAVCLLAVCLAAGQREWTDARNVTALQSLLTAAEADGPRAAYAAEALGTIVSAVEVDGDRVQFHMEAVAIHVKGDPPLRNASERLLVQLRLTAQLEQGIAAALQRGDQVRVAGELTRPATATNSGGFDYRRYLSSQKIHWLLKAKGTAAITPSTAVAPPDSAVITAAATAVTQSADLASPLSKPNYTAELLGRVDDARAWLGAQLDPLYPSDQSGYMKGLILGIRDDLAPEQFQQFSRLGLTHILAISGLHVAVFMYALSGFLKLFRMTRERIVVTLMFAVPLYVLLAGASPSVLRAGLMAVLGLLAARLGKLKDGLHLLAAAAVGLLIIDPYYLDNVSFQLSFIVTLGLIVGVPPVRRALPNWKKSGWLLDLTTVTIVAQLVSFPVTLYYFNQFHLLSLIANFILVPFISFIVMPLGALALLISMVWHDGAKLIASISIYANNYSFALVDLLAEFDSLRTIWATPPLWWVLCWLLLLGSAFQLVEYWNSTRLEVTEGQLSLDQQNNSSDVTTDLFADEQEVIAPLNSIQKKGLFNRVVLHVIVAVGLLLFAYYPDHFNKEAVVSFLDVGQGDSALIRTPSGKHILIDGGGTMSFHKPGEEWRLRRDPFEVGQKVVVPLLMKRGVKEIDLLVISHLDSDHIRGLIAVSEHIPIKQVWWNGSLKNANDVNNLFKNLLSADIPMYAPLAGENKYVDRDTFVQVLWPQKKQIEQLSYMEEQNEHSLVLAINLYGNTFLFPGDISSETEEEIVRTIEGGVQITSPILKLAHHGSRYSTSEKWLAYWKPKGAIASVGATNTYGHPHPDVLARLEGSRSMLWRTDLNGEIVFRVSEFRLYVSKS